MRKTRKRSFFDKGLCLLCALGLAAGAVGLCLFPCPRLSVQENRLLADFPVATASRVADGSYTAALDTYATERFPARVPFRRARAVIRLALGEREVGGVILCRDGSLAKRILVNERAFAQNLHALQHLASSGYTVAVAPRRVDARREVLPACYDTSADLAPWQALSAALPSAVAFPDLNADAHWYRTDHHWTTRGAYEAYCRLGTVLGYTPYPESAFRRETVSTAFYGTSEAHAGIPFLSPDSIELWRYDGDTEFSVSQDGKGGVLYDTSCLEGRDKYAVFCGGNHGILKVTAKEPRPTLLLIKDSFANAIIPFLARHYNVVAADPRYGGTLTDALPHADARLVLCGMQTLCETFFLKI